MKVYPASFVRNGYLLTPRRWEHVFSPSPYLRIEEPELEAGALN